jgi:hypothetical protein
MKARWLAGILLFSLGFGCALMIQPPSAGASATQGVVEGTLKYVDGDDAFELLYPPGGDKKYLVLARRDLDSVQAGDPQVTYHTGGAKFSKKGLRSLLVLRIEPLIAWQDDVVRCEHLPILCVLPPPPPPPIHDEADIIQSGQYP